MTSITVIERPMPPSSQSPNARPQSIQHAYLSIDSRPESRRGTAALAARRSHRRDAPAARGPERRGQRGAHRRDSERRRTLCRPARPSALAGLSLVFPLLMLMQQVANSSMGGAIASAIARAIGSGRHEDASALVVHALMIACGMATVFTAVLLVAGPPLLRADGRQWLYSRRGRRVLETRSSPARWPTWILSTLTSVVRGAGQAAVLAIVYIGAEILHILLVPTLVSASDRSSGSRSPAPALATVTSSPSRRRCSPGTWRPAHRGHLLAAGRPAQLGCFPAKSCGSGRRCRSSRC